jgi:hypothetical protein
MEVQVQLQLDMAWVVVQVLDLEQEEQDPQDSLLSRSFIKMKEALISPQEPRKTGYRVAQVEQQEFEVALPLFWVDCADDVVADQFWYDPVDQTIKPITS